jgi:hypothetical protein
VGRKTASFFELSEEGKEEKDRKKEIDVKSMSVSDLLHSIKSSQSYENQIFQVEEMPSRQPEHASIELKPLINYALDQIGIKYRLTGQGISVKIGKYNRIAGG